MASNHRRPPNNLTFHTHITVNLRSTTVVLRIVYNLNIRLPIAFVLQYDLLGIQVFCNVSLTFIKNVVPSCSQRRTSRTETSKDDQLTLQVVWFSIAAHLHVHLQDTSSRTQGGCPPCVLLSLSQDLLRCTFVQCSTVPLALRYVVMNTHSGQLSEFSN